MVAGQLAWVEWTRSKAYAIGLNSIYLNLSGREGSGIVRDDEVEQLSQELKDGLQTWSGPDNRQVVQRAYLNKEALDGSLAPYGPDLLVGYSPGYRASQKTGLGEWESESVELNNDHWSADHCIDPDAVSGVLFSSRGLADFPQPSYRDIPALVVGEGWSPDESSAPPPDMNDEDREAIEERLKSLGYL